MHTNMLAFEIRILTFLSLHPRTEAHCWPDRSRMTIALVSVRLQVSGAGGTLMTSGLHGPRAAYTHSHTHKYTHIHRVKAESRIHISIVRYM
jgi:hypothetical protein